MQRAAGATVEAAAAQRLSAASEIAPVHPVASAGEAGEIAHPVLVVGEAAEGAVVGVEAVSAAVVGSEGEFGNMY
jgi:hypothetical protein